MDDFFTAIMVLVIGALLGMIITLVVNTVLLSDTYRDGQIDCLNNQIYYELQTQPDGSTEWMYVAEGVK